MKRSFLLSIRLLMRDKFHSSLNIIGLGVGITATIIIFLYLQNELNYDRHHLNHERIYRVASIFMTSNEPVKFAVSSPSLGPRLMAEYPEIRSYVRMIPRQETLFKVDDKLFYEEGVTLVDSTVFDVFTYKFISGDPATCMRNPSGIVLTESLAKKYFGDKDPMGQEILVETSRPVVVTAVIQDPPGNSHVAVKAFVAISNWDKSVDAMNWPVYEIEPYTYLLVDGDFDPEAFKRKLGPFYKKYVDQDKPNYNQEFVPVFQKLSEIHYGRNDLRADYPVGNTNHLYIFGCIGLFILALSCINYINLATARAAGRSKSVWIKKFVGASRSSLIRDFMIESAVLALVSLGLGLALSEITLNIVDFNTTLGLKTDILNNKALQVFLVVVFLIAGLIAGIYPSFFMSRSTGAGKAVTVSDRSRGVRNALVFFQFTISILVINFTFLIQHQLDYLQHYDLGFDKEHVLSVQMTDTLIANRYEVLKASLLQYPGVVSVSSGRSRPGSLGTGLYQFESESGFKEHNFRVMAVNFGFFETLGLKIVQGRSFDQNMGTDREAAVIVNEALVRAMGWSDPIGKEIRNPDFKGKVVGVVKNFNVSSLHNEVPPVMIRMTARPRGRMLIRYTGDDTQGLLALIRQQWTAISNERPLVYDFISDEFKAMYAKDELQSDLVKKFSMISVLISCLGLLGLTSYSATKRIKEIGIRKVLGASVWSIVMMLGRKITLLVILAIMLSSGLSVWLFMSWVQTFAYQTEVPAWIFAITGTLTLCVVWLTISYHYIKAASTNPANVLRYE
ncbi:ABC transporter permease [Fulvivirgaceae bacterium PWU4]|uniref:ABC transporter permease n=1 Tax=Chryseosolibacter histidini TaxID=2782349 RepID=A0AAP2DL66_9BACT|nr:ABC transporter permease [Chryseosolibacter histidini]MBT1698403.1 ABC transporter permease [Chryseosolibacter histidini]